MYIHVCISYISIAAMHAYIQTYIYIHTYRYRVEYAYIYIYQDHVKYMIQNSVGTRHNAFACRGWSLQAPL